MACPTCDHGMNAVLPPEGYATGGFIVYHCQRCGTVTTNKGTLPVVPEIVSRVWGEIMPNPSELQRQAEPDPARELAERIICHVMTGFRSLPLPQQWAEIAWVADRLREFRAAPRREGRDHD